MPIRNLLSLQRSPLGGLWLLAQEQAGFARLEQDVWVLHQPDWNDSTEQITFGYGVMGFAPQDSGFWWTGNLFDYRHITAAGYVKSTHSLVHWDGSSWTLWDLPGTIGGVPSSLLPLWNASGSCFVLLATQAKWYELQCAQ